MKFVIKSGSIVKLFSGEMKIEALAQFLKENFANWNTNNLYYVDADGDRIMIRLQEDIDAMLAMNPHSQFLKLDFVEEKGSDHDNYKKVEPTKTQEVQKSQKTITINQKTETKPEIKKETVITSISTEKMEEKLPETSSQKRSLSKKRFSKKHHTSSSEQSSGSSTEQKMKKVEEIINQKVAMMVDQRIKSLIPCIKNQLNQQIDSSINQTQGTLRHQGIKCNGCGSEPISGIRYKCLKCVNFNLCEKCEEKIEHQHNLLKMKKPEENESQTLKKSECLYRIGRKFFKQFNRKHSSSHSHQRQHSHRHGKWRGHGKGRFGCGQNSQHRIHRKLFKLQSIFGQQPDFKQFILNNTQLKGWQLIQLYASQKNISQQELQQKTNQMRKQKLSAFYDCPETEFDEIVKTYPKLGFRELIVKMKQEGLRTYTGENFKRMRQKCRRERREGSGQKKEERRQRRSQSRGRGRKFEEKRSMDKSLKKQILKEMETLFGEEKSFDYKHFIRENKSLTKEDIIAKWIEKLTL